ncbi:MAG: ATP-binding protein [Pseudomonadota bacterium]
MSEETSNERFWGSYLFVRLALFVLLLAVMAFIWISSLYATQIFSEQKRSEAARELSLYSGRLISEIQRVSVAPALLATDQSFYNDLTSGDFQTTSQKLIEFRDEIRAKSIRLMDRDGIVVASSERRDLGENMRANGFFNQAMRSNQTVFTLFRDEANTASYFYSHRLREQGSLRGVIAVEIAIENLFITWSDDDAILMVTDPSGIVIESTQRQFLNTELETELTTEPTLTVLDRVIDATGGISWYSNEIDAYIEGQPLYRLDTAIPFRGWGMTYLTPFQSVREKVYGVVALEITVLAILAALVFYTLSRRATRQSFLFKAESEELRGLNERLTKEITQRERAEKELRVAEASLEQSSKLAALGEMSAAVSHELNQPLAAMRTYLAGAKLLLNRRRPNEAQASFQRIEDLIDRMGQITKQLKSYARKGSDELIAIDMVQSIHASIALMAGQLTQANVEMATAIPNEPVMILADPVRIEQVIVNLLRNALDATKGQTDRRLTITLEVGEMAVLMVQDNGPGIENLSDLFEPFYTTKKPGEGVGLGLAISAGIAKDLDGRLFARNLEPRGAVFEFSIPRLDNQGKEAAE